MGYLARDNKANGWLDQRGIPYWAKEANGNTGNRIFGDFRLVLDIGFNLGPTANPGALLRAACQRVA